MTLTAFKSARVIYLNGQRCNHEQVDAENCTVLLFVFIDDKDTLKRYDLQVVTENICTDGHLYTRCFTNINTELTHIEHGISSSIKCYNSKTT